MSAEEAVSFAVETLGNLPIENVFPIDVRGKVEWLRDELKRMQCFLKDAAKKQSDSDRIRNWISEIREVTYDAEDTIEMFVVNVENRGLQERCACFPDHLNRLDKIGKEIKSIRKRLKDIESSRLSYGIQYLGESSRSRSQLQVESLRRLAYWTQDRDVVGLEKDVELLLEKAILKEGGGLSVASIVGMGGIGKSTLAKEIYNHPEIVDQFECRVWVVVTSEFTAEGIMGQILMKLMIPLDGLLQSVDDDLMRQQRLQNEVYRSLTGKRYFIVLDDIWEPIHWQRLETLFPKEDKESRVLLTSRNQDVGAYNQFVHNMKGLDINQSWTLFTKKTFIDNTDGKCPEELQNIGTEILKWCDGLPLAIIVVGGLLQKKTLFKSEWEKVAKEMISHLKRNNEINVISAILEISYHNLPPELKACFLYLGLFKEDKIIEAKNLVHIWIAQGLVAQEVVGEEETMEDVATYYLNQLISRNMVQVKSREYDVVKACHMDNLLRDLSHRKAMKEIRLEILFRENGDSHNSLHKPRHGNYEYLTMDDGVKICCLDCILRAVCLRRRNEKLALKMRDEAEVISHNSRHRVVYGGDLKTLSLNGSEYLRSLFLMNNEGVGVDVDVSSVSHDFWKSCQLLRILYLDGIKLSTFPDSLSALVRLKYLMIRRHKIHPECALDEVEDYLEAVKLPNWLDDLKHLEILDMEGEKVEFPKDVTLKMKTLRYFSAYCVRGPKSINSWGNIETLKYMRQEDWMECYSTLNSSCNVRKLGLFLGLLNRADGWREVRASLESLKKLKHLQLRWNRFVPFDPPIIATLHTLTKLKLRGKLSKCPDASMFPPNLTHLTLAFSDLREDLATELSKLRHLRYLKLLHNAYEAERMQVLHGGFPSLKAFSLREMFLLKFIDIAEGGMPCLEQLQIQQCPSLHTDNLPRRVVIEHIT